MSQLRDEFVLPRVEMTNNMLSRSTVMDIVDPLFVRNQNAPSPSSPAEIVDRARKIFRAGKTRSLTYRRGQLKALLKFFEECRLDIEEALYQDLGKHPLEVNADEVILVTNDIEHTLIELKRWASPKRPSRRWINILDQLEIRSEPYGVVLVIGAWNYPVLLALGPLVGAIAAGNCVVLKPSELSPATTNLFVKLLTKYLDRETFYIVQGGPAETTQLLAEKFDYIFFTGSTAVGRIVHQAAAKHLTPTTLELGGKSPCYLDDTIDMKMATRRILWGKFMNAGQTCVAPDYLICTKDVQDKFLIHAKEILKEFYGDQRFPTDMSRIVNERHFQRLCGLLENADAIIGGRSARTQLAISPTIVIGVKKGDPLMRDEIFGPILPILNVSNATEAIEYINDHEKPLALYVFTENQDVRRKFLEETSSGSLTINDTIMQICTEGLPFGGVGASGMGAYHGKAGFDTFSHQKSVLIAKLNPVTEMGLQCRYPPYTDKKLELVNLFARKRRGVDLSHKSNFLSFLAGIATACLIYIVYRYFYDGND